MLLACYSLLSFSIGIYRALAPRGSQDLAPIYIAAHLWIEGTNPYDERNHEPFWRTVPRADPVVQSDSLPKVATSYPPAAIVNLAPLSIGSWGLARALFLALNVALLAWIPWAVRRLWHPEWTAKQFGVFLLFWFGGAPVRIHLGEGQHCLIVVACVIAAAWAVRNGRPITVGILLAIALHKFIFLVFLVPLLLVKRMVRTLTAMTGFAAAVVALFAIRLGEQALAAFAQFRDLMLLFLGSKREGLGVSGLGVTDLFPLLRSLAGNPRLAGVAMSVLVVAALVLCCLIARRSRVLTEADVALALLFSLWTMYHDTYDAIPLVFPAAMLVSRFVSRPGARPVWQYLGLVFLAGIWLADPPEMGRVLNALAAPVTGRLEILEQLPWIVYRLSFTAVFAAVLAVHFRSQPAEARSASGAIAA